MKKRVMILLISVLFIANLFAQDEINRNKYFFILPEETQIFAVSDGTVLSYGVSPEDGMYIEVDYLDLGMIIKYCNLRNFVYIFENDYVKKGDLIGKTGWTGNIPEPGITFYISVNKMVLNSFFY